MNYLDVLESVDDFAVQPATCGSLPRQNNKEPKLFIVLSIALHSVGAFPAIFGSKVCQCGQNSVLISAS